MPSMLGFVVLVIYLTLSVPTSATQNEENLMLQARKLSSSASETRDWPSLRFHFKLKRNTMDIYGHDDFSVYANPVMAANGTSVLYDVFATFQEDAIEYNYTLVDGVGYLRSGGLEAGPAASSVECLSSDMDDFPQINAIVSALNEATALSSVSTSARAKINCPVGNVYKASVSGFDFAVCAVSDSGFQMYSRDVDIDVEYLESRVSIVSPKTDSSEKCGAEVESNAVTATSKSLLTGTSVTVNGSRKLAADISLWYDDDPVCSCKSTPRPCIFIHGLGVKDETPDNEDSSTYWGISPTTRRAAPRSSIRTSTRSTTRG